MVHENIQVATIDWLHSVTKRHLSISIRNISWLLRTVYNGQNAKRRICLTLKNLSCCNLPWFLTDENKQPILRILLKHNQYGSHSNACLNQYVCCNTHLKMLYQVWNAPHAWSKVSKNGVHVPHLSQFITIQVCITARLQ